MERHTHPRRGLAAALALAVAAAPAGGRAEAPADGRGEAPAGAEARSPAALDVVELQDGGLLRGTIVELRPGASVTIVAAVDGSTRTFAWAEVRSTRVGEGPAAPAAPQAAVTDEGGALGRPRVWIEARGRRPVHLFTAGEGPLVLASSPTTVRSGVVLRSVCQAPCGAAIDGRAGYPFHFGGDRMPLSRPFYLAHTGGDLTAEVRPGRVGLLVAGILATSYGSAGTIGGATLLAVSPDQLGRPGAIVLGIGAALLAGGIVMLVYGRTRYRLRPGRPIRG